MTQWAKTFSELKTQRDDLRDGEKKNKPRDEPRGMIKSIEHIG
jgi:hypothetical protein